MPLSRSTPGTKGTRFAGNVAVGRTGSHHFIPLPGDGEIRYAGRSRRTHMRLSRQFALLSAMMLLIMGTLLGGGMRTLAQDDATPEATGDAAAASRPAHVHTGSCDAVGEVVAPLADLTAAVGTAAGQMDDDDDLVEYSFTNVPMSLDDMLAADHVVNVHESADNIENYIACGEIGGVVDANGSLVIALHEQNDSGFSGIAVLTRNVADPATTDISSFVHGDDDATDDSADDSGDDD